jgi:peptidoglycan hydrolase-like protein with peptidoglycan-binding domain
MSIYLSQGAIGSNVKHLQVMLNYLVVQKEQLKVDGIFGPKTRTNVVQFQQTSNLGQDGIVGPLTSKALFRSVFSAILK